MREGDRDEVPEGGRDEVPEEGSPSSSPDHRSLRGQAGYTVEKCTVQKSSQEKREERTDRGGWRHRVVYGVCGR